MIDSERTMLQGKAAIVTGSMSGIGLGIAQVLAQAGANILLNGLATGKRFKPCAMV